MILALIAQLSPADITIQTLDAIYGSALIDVARAATPDSVFNNQGFEGLDIGTLSGFIYTFKNISTILTIVFGAIFFYAVVQLIFLRRSIEAAHVMAEAESGEIPAPAVGGPLTARWGEIMRHMDSAREEQWKLAVLEADKLTDDVMRRAGFVGDTMGERLMNTEPGQLASLNKLWEAHRTRNRIAHELDYTPRYAEARRAVDYFADALREFGVL